ncbi:MULTISPECIES: putative sulfate exporter family transporter [unclassified Pseudomonas]|uniref:YeiH family protein n=1 Tax=unclassified Pseudomonas TaxID=196821 RepID=UPI002446D069|nr:MULTISPECIES: putative sulfate exporter family transporter [unclassified Pseudomonas]MDG9924711.1 putative sulfate exporter family transporter [Pseudomonas sp. GD04045]MDH0036692.1 putative sulfate exporter family transporter [Pseudomonas sp. GD04019]
MSAIALTQINDRARQLAPGISVSLVVAAAATFLSEHYGAPVMLFALLLGLSLNFLAAEGKCKAGIEFTARTVLRVGVALLGMRITLEQIAALGWKPLALVVILVVVTISVSVLAAKALGFKRIFGMLTGGATAICGASAALALAAALPSHPQKEKATLFTVIGVSALSTLAMILYPMIANALGLSPQEAGVFLGATIHDVAQVVGAGYSMSPETGDIATVVKLMRVAMLLPVIVAAAMVTRLQGAETAGERPPLLPWFAVGFLILACVNSTGLVPEVVQGGVNELSRWCLVVSIAALGMKTQLKELASVGIKPILLMVGETIFLVILVLLLLRWGL